MRGLGRCERNRLTRNVRLTGELRSSRLHHSDEGWTSEDPAPFAAANYAGQAAEPCHGEINHCVKMHSGKAHRPRRDGPLSLRRGRFADSFRFLGRGLGLTAIRARAVIAVTALVIGSLPVPGLVLGAETNGLRLATACHGTARVTSFLNQDRGIERERYRTEVATGLQWDLLALGDSLVLQWDFRLASIMGESVSENLPFSPMEVVYSWTPVLLEYTRGGRLWRLGWDHVCHHLIYKDTGEPWYDRTGGEFEADVFYNRVFAGYGVPFGRPALRWLAVKEGAGGPVAWHERFLWYAEAGYYLRDLGGLMDSESLWGSNDWQWDVRADASVLAWRNRWFAVFAHGSATVLADTDNEVFWRGRAEAEVLLPGGGFGLSFYGAYTPVDEHPRDSREGLGEIGARGCF
jgi:hypothetical protein